MLAAIAKGEVEPVREMPSRATVMCPNGLGKPKLKPLSLARGRGIRAVALVRT